MKRNEIILMLTKANVEIWRDIKGYIGVYQVSNLGRVKSLNYRRTGKEKILKISANSKSGYLQVLLYKNGQRKMFKVHRLVAIAFIPNDNSERDSIDHINIIKTDNRVCNLRWCTHKENMNNPLSIGKMSKAQKDRKHSEETKQKLRVAMKEYHTTLTEEERKEKYGHQGENNPMYGKNPFENKTEEEMKEIRRKMGKGNARKVKCIETGIIFDCIKDAQKYCGLKAHTGIVACCKGKQETAGGYHWEYA